MTTSPKISVLKDVVAYVDVWSSDKTANYSKPFVQQLQEMGAQVPKTFNKQVTHVVFNNGHPATWRKAKKSDVKLVSVLWIGRCFEDGVHVDEDLYPALNDESNPVLKNKKHRCMQPKDSPERTPENDKRMKKKLDKMMKVLAHKQPLVTDVSPIIIDEESGIVYSPALKRSDYMAQRLKDMKEKRENLSPTASQIVDSTSPTGLKPSLGSTPTVFKLMFDQSDDDSSASAAEPGCSPDKEECRTQVDVTDHDHLKNRHRKISDKPWLSPCREVPKMISSPLNCPDFEDSGGNQQKKLKRTTVRKKPAEKHSPKGSLKSPCPDRKPDTSSNLCKEKSRSQIKSFCSSPKKSEKAKQKVNADKTVKKTKTSICPDNVNSSCLASPTISSNAAFERETTTPFKKLEQKVSKHARTSLSALVRSTPSGEPHSVTPGFADSDDNVFEDYFSPANNKQRPKKSLLSNLPSETNIYIPFELDTGPKKRKVRRSDSIGSETKKKRKHEESQCGKNQQLDESSQTQQDSKEALHATDSSHPSGTLAKKRRQSTLPFTSTSDTLKQRRASLQSTVLTEDNALSKMKQKSNIRAHSHSSENVRRGNECTVAAAVTKILSEGEITSDKQIGLDSQKMISKTKAVRTLVMTSMPTEKQHTVIQVVKALGGFLITDQVCESTTHVVSGGHRRTLNILLGIAHGCWILSFEWILWCLEKRQWIPEEPYELSDQFPAAQICRLQRHLSAGEHQQDLFQGQPPMFVSQHSQPPTQSLVELIQLCGGTVCKTMRQAGICIGRHSGRRPEGSRVLSEQWVLDSITHLKQLSYDGYELE